MAVVLSVAGTRYYVRARTIETIETCRANLNQLRGAKDGWAREHSKAERDIPAWTNLIGPKAYIREMPICPRGGTYTLGPVGQPARCSIPEHALPQ